MRPASIVTFERIVLLIVLLSAASAFLEWDRTVAQLAAAGVGSGALIGTLAAALGLTLLLAWLIARRRSNAARWIYILLTLLMIALAVPSLPRVLDAGLATIALNVAYLLLALFSILLLFRDDSRRWLSGGGDPAL